MCIYSRIRNGAHGYSKVCHSVNWTLIKQQAKHEWVPPPEPAAPSPRPRAALPPSPDDRPGHLPRRVSANFFSFFPPSWMPPFFFFSILYLFLRPHTFLFFNLFSRFSSASSWVTLTPYYSKSDHCLEGAPRPQGYGLSSSLIILVFASFAFFTRFKRSCMFPGENNVREKSTMLLVNEQ